MEAFERIYRQHVDAVFRFARHCVGRREIAEELTSEAFLALLRNSGSVEEHQLPAWLIAVVRNRAVDYWRRNAVERRYAAAVEEQTQTPAQPLATWLLESKALKPLHRTCLILRYVHGMDRAEIARRTGLTDNQIKSCLQYALQLLRKELGESAK